MSSTDFNEFARQNGDADALPAEEWQAYGRKQAIVTFEVDRKGSVSGKYRGMIVFRDHDSENLIKAGETWVCTLQPNPSSAANYFARAVQKVDSSFMFALKKDQIAEIAAALWRTCPDALMPALEEMYGVQNAAATDKAVEEAVKAVKQANDQLTAQVNELMQTDLGNKKIIASLEARVKEAEARPPARAVPTPPAAPGRMMPFPGPQLDICVRRESSDMLSSPSFDQARYFVHLSADRRVLLVRPHPNGNVICTDQTIVLAGLGMLVPFTAACDLVCEYDADLGGIRIYLK